MLLDSICNSKVYKENAYYLLGLQVGVSGRKLKRRIEDLQNAGAMGDADWNKAYDAFLLGSSVAPDKVLFEEMAERIKDPECAITHAFFWFWPTNPSVDPAIEAIGIGDKSTAFEVWRRMSTKSNREAIIAKHNLAVLFHYYAIDAEECRLASSAQTNTDEYLTITDRYWRTAFSYWEELVDDDEFWDAFADRVAAFDDPRLGREFVLEFRRQFPISFDNINADYLVAYAQKGKLEDAKRHFSYMTETMSGSDDVDETLNAAFKPQIDKLRLHIKHCRDSKVAEEGLKDIQQVLEGSQELFRIFRFLLPAENRLRKDLMNDVAKACHSRLPSYANKTDDYESALLIEKDLLDLASTSSLRNVINAAIAQLEKIVKDKREANTCWYCKTYNEKGVQKRIVELYGNVTPDFSQVGRVTFSTRKIHIPVCSNCSHRFSLSTARDYPAVKSSLANGWKLGDKPSDAEIDAVWLGVTDLLKGAFGKRGF